MSVYGDRDYRKRRAALLRQVRKNNTPCHLCGRPFDWALIDSLSDTDRRKHPLSFEADHINPLARGGKLLDVLAPSHKRCNGRRQDKPLGLNKPQRKPIRSRPLSDE